MLLIDQIACTANYVQQLGLRCRVRLVCQLQDLGEISVWLPEEAATEEVDDEAEAEEGEDHAEEHPSP